MPSLPRSSGWRRSSSAGGGLSPGALVVAIAESRLVGGDCFDDVRDLRADQVGAPLRAVRAIPSAPTAR